MQQGRTAQVADEVHHRLQTMRNLVDVCSSLDGLEELRCVLIQVCTVFSSILGQIVPNNTPRAAN